MFHLAAQSYPKTSFVSPVDTINTNILGTVKLLEAIKKKCCDAVVHVCASSEVFGRVSKDKLPINEECNFHPASPYAISKVGTDLLGRFYGEAYGKKQQECLPILGQEGDVLQSLHSLQIAMIANLIDPVKTGI